MSDERPTPVIPRPDSWSPAMRTADFGDSIPADQRAALLRRIPASCRPWGRGWCAAAACILEASAPKPGNVHPAADFDDLSHAELVAAGIAIAPAMEAAAARPLGRSILDAVTASRRCTRSNANLGIVLAIAPLAAVPDGVAGEERVPFGTAAIRPEAVAALLGGLSADDAAAVWRAIAIAAPGGMGTTGRCDVAGPPPADLLEAMRLAAPRDRIARLWTEGYRDLFDGLVRDLDEGLASGIDLSDAIVRAFLRQLARCPDSLIARKHGDVVAADVSARAAGILSLPPDERPAALAAFDRELRQPQRVNPGTTADLVAAALYILLRSGRLRTFVEPLLPATA